MDDVLCAVDLDHGPGLVDCSETAPRNAPQQACTGLIQWPVPVAAEQGLGIPAQPGGALRPPIGWVEETRAVIHEKLPSVPGDT
jgi:hypothetical protein